MISHPFANGALRAVFVVAGIGTAGQALSHEMWLDAQQWQVKNSAPIITDMRVGQNFEGAIYGYLPSDTARLDLIAGGTSAPIVSRAGDRPAVNVVPPTGGLAVVAYASTVQTTRYKDFQTFAEFVAHKDLGDAVARHDARGLAREPFNEAYFRYAKALVAVGDGAGSDRMIGPDGGFETELVALENPYLDLGDGAVDVQLFYRGAPRANEQIEVFARDSADAVTITTVRTDGEGKATIPVMPGSRYMLDAVVLREPSESLATEKAVLWESLWANLTFAVPLS